MDMVVIEDYLPYVNNGWKHKLDETNTYIVIFFSKP